LAPYPAGSELSVDGQCDHLSGIESGSALIYSYGCSFPSPSLAGWRVRVLV